MIDYEAARMSCDDAENPEYQDAVQCDCCMEYFSANEMDTEICPDCGGALLDVPKELED